MILSEEIARIRSTLADIGCETMFGMTCEELAKKIITQIIDEKEN